jgi:hypothetical protein
MFISQETRLDAKLRQYLAPAVPSTFDRAHAPPAFACVLA